MSTISPLLPTAPSVAPPSTSSLDETRTQFLTLLITQLQNQDPLSPADTDTMTSQMMSLGQLEQLFDLNEGMQSLIGIQGSSLVSSYTGMVGKSATSIGDTINLTDTNKGQFSFDISQIPEETTIRVFDGFGSLVRTIPLDIQQVGLIEVPFDGLNKLNVPLANGTYSYTVETLDRDGNQILNTSYTTGTISGIRISNGTPIIQVDGSDRSATEIQRIF